MENSDFGISENDISRIVNDAIIPALGDYVATIGSKPMYDWTRDEVRAMINLIIVEFYVKAPPLPDCSH